MIVISYKNCKLTRPLMAYGKRGNIYQSALTITELDGAIKLGLKNSRNNVSETASLEIPKDKNVLSDIIRELENLRDSL